MTTQKLTEEQIKLLSEQRFWMVATATKDGKANVAAKGAKKVIDDTTLAYAEILGGTTHKNIQDNPWVTIGAADPSTGAEIRCSGETDICSSGDLFDEMSARLESRGRPKPKAVIKIKIAEIR